MVDRFSKFLDRASEFLAHRKGLLPLVGILLICLNFILKSDSRAWLDRNQRSPLAPWHNDRHPRFFISPGALISIPCDFRLLRDLYPGVLF